MSIVAQESFWGHLSFHFFVALTVQYCNPVCNLYKRPGFVWLRWPTDWTKTCNVFWRWGKKGWKKKRAAQVSQNEWHQKFWWEKKGLDDFIYSDFRRHKFDTHFMMKVTFLLRNPITLGFHGLSKADDDDDGNQNHNNNIYNTYLRWFPPPRIFPASFPIPKTKITPWRDKWDLSTLVIKNPCRSHPWQRRMSDACRNTNG